MNLRNFAAFSSLIALCAGPVQASDIQFSGFGSFVAGIKDHDNSESYAGYRSHNFTFEPDSLIGLQATAQINEKVTGSVQLVSRGAQDWNTQVDWAYISYQVTDEFAWRAGRLRVPFFLYSDFITVGYAYPWVSPPFETYSSPFSNLDGVDFIYRFSIDSVDMLVQGYLGSDTFTVDENFGSIGNFEGEVNKQFGIVAEASWSDFKLRYAYHAADVTLTPPDGTALAGLQAGLAAFGFDRTLERFTFDEDYFDFHDIALLYDNGTVIFVAEATTASGDDEIPGASSTNTYYVTGGYRFGAFTALLTYAVQDDEEADLLGELDPTNPGYSLVDPNTGLTIAQAAAITESALASDTEQYTLGLRWDFSPGLAFKAEMIDHTDNKNAVNDAIITRAGVQFVF
jgi:hypothetical protein